MDQIQEFLEQVQTVGEFPPSAQPLVFVQQERVLAWQIKDLRLVNHHAMNKGEVEELQKEGFRILAVLVIRDDGINYGNSGASAARHKVVAVMFRKKEEEVEEEE